MYKDGQIITDHKAFANWANANGNKFYDVANGDGTYTVHKVVVSEPTIDEQNAVISDKRASEYARLIDPLHAEKARKTVLGEWTEELESEYVAQVKALTKQIQDENPYVAVPEQEPETAE